MTGFGRRVFSLGCYDTLKQLASRWLVLLIVLLVCAAVCIARVLPRFMRHLRSLQVNWMYIVQGMLLNQT